MFGSEYHRRPEILVKSIRAMNKSYKKTISARSGRIVQLLQSLYIWLFGIPEIGFQVRGMYFRLALNRISHPRVRRIADLGSGIGCYALFLGRTYPQVQVVGWDLDQDKLRLAKKLAFELKINNVLFQRRDILQNSFLPRKYYDLITSIDVLEHVQDYQKALKNISAMLKSGGYFFLHVPQETQNRYFAHFKSWQHDDHVRTGFNPEKLTGELQKQGFRIISRRNTFGLFGSLAWELHHLCLAYSQILGALAYPFLYLLACLDLAILNKKGLGIAIFAEKA